MTSRSLVRLEDIPGHTDGVVTIGMFDGVHSGHQHLLGQLVQRARQIGGQPIVVCFFPHPDVYLHGHSGRYYLTTPERRAELLVEQGVAYVVTLPFDEELRLLPPETFVAGLRRYARLRELVVGPDFAIGHQRSGDLEFLRRQGDAYGFQVTVVPPLAIETSPGRVSSSAIRRCLGSGDVQQAELWLGRPYRVSGPVVMGNQRGRTIGFPTANLDVWDQQVLPSLGVYAGRAVHRGQVYDAVANIGVRPTFNGDAPTVEVHLLEYSGDLYGEVVAFDFHARLRDEQRFTSVDALVAQIMRDVANARQLLSTGAEPR
jgi:riboflavin kinase / FMN adenylyltransferase